MEFQPQTIQPYKLGVQKWSCISESGAHYRYDTSIFSARPTRVYLSEHSFFCGLNFNRDWLFFVAESKAVQALSVNGVDQGHAVGVRVPVSNAVGIVHIRTTFIFKC